MSEPLTRDEFLAHMSYLREDIAGVNERLDALNGRTRKVEAQSGIHSWAIGLGGAGSLALFAWLLSKI